MKTYASKINTKLAELSSVIDDRRAKAKDEETKAKVASLTRQKKVLLVVNELLSLIPDNTQLSKYAIDALTSWTAPIGERPLAFSCKAGDSILDLLDKYPNFSGKKLRKYCSEHGLVYNSDTKMIEAAPGK